MLQWLSRRLFVYVHVRFGNLAKTDKAATRSARPHPSSKQTTVTRHSSFKTGADVPRLMDSMIDSTPGA
jgi:hypothetical protein